MFANILYYFKRNYTFPIGFIKHLIFKTLSAYFSKVLRNAFHAEVKMALLLEIGLKLEKIYEILQILVQVLFVNVLREIIYLQDVIQNMINVSRNAL